VREDRNARKPSFRPAQGTTSSSATAAAASRSIHWSQSLDRRPSTAPLQRPLGAGSSSSREWGATRPRHSRRFARLGRAHRRRYAKSLRAEGSGVRLLDLGNKTSSEIVPECSRRAMVKAFNTLFHVVLAGTHARQEDAGSSSYPEMMQPPRPRCRADRPDRVRAVDLGGWSKVARCSKRRRARRFEPRAPTLMLPQAVPPARR